MVDNGKKNVVEGKRIGSRKEWKVLGSRFELPEKFEIIDPVGSGAYGVVVAAKDTQEESENNTAAAQLNTTQEKTTPHTAQVTFHMAQHGASRRRTPGHRTHDRQGFRWGS